MNKRNIYVKLTDKYIYVYSNKVLKTYNSKYIKNGKVDNVHKLISYLNSILNKGILKKRYIFILDTLLCNSDLFVYRYVFDNMGLLNYKIVNDIDIIKHKLTNDNLIIMNWNSSLNYCYVNNNEVVVSRYNPRIINQLNKKYALTCGDEQYNYSIETPIFDYENKKLLIFNFIEESR